MYTSGYLPLDFDFQVEWEIKRKKKKKKERKRKRSYKAPFFADSEPLITIRQSTIQIRHKKEIKIMVLIIEWKQKMLKAYLKRLSSV